MEKTIKRELTAIENKFNSMVEEYREIKENHGNSFWETLENIRSPFSLDGVTNIDRMILQEQNVVIIAIDRKKAEQVKGTWWING